MSSKDLSLRQQIFTMLEKDHELKAKQLCKLMDLDYVQYKNYACKVRSEWKAYRRDRQALKCLSFHNTRAWIYALTIFGDRKDLRLVDRALLGGWIQSNAKNKFLLFKVRSLGRLEWFETGRINIWVKKPATIGRIKQLLAEGFLKVGFISDVQVFDLWASSARLKGSHLAYDLGEKIPYSRIDFLKDALGVVVKTGDLTHPTCVELEFVYPRWAERNELLFERLQSFFSNFQEKRIDGSQDKRLYE
jgi:hypothetical protein